jgi:multicomponent Na+:H+ antiporter subunit B
MVARLLLVPILMVAVAILVKGYVDVGDGVAAGVFALVLGMVVATIHLIASTVEERGRRP